MWHSTREFLIISPTLNWVQKATKLVYEMLQMNTGKESMDCLFALRIYSGFWGIFVLGIYINGSEMQDCLKWSLLSIEIPALQ
jgi:hypothetical protein